MGLLFARAMDNAFKDCISVSKASAVSPDIVCWVSRYKSFFCVHSGISPEALKLDQIRILNRFQEVVEGGIINDLLNSVPQETQKPGDTSKTFNSELIAQFLEQNNLKRMIRSGQLCMDGFQEIYDKRLSTIWSAPNFNNRCGNVGCILEINETSEFVYNTLLLLQIFQE